MAGADNTADIVGVAAAPASGTTNANRQFVLAAGNIFEVTLEDETNTDPALLQQMDARSRGYMAAEQKYDRALRDGSLR